VILLGLQIYLTKKYTIISKKLVNRTAQIIDFIQKLWSIKTYLKSLISQERFEKFVNLEIYV
jgi:hypothetical protein